MKKHVRKVFSMLLALVIIMSTVSMNFYAGAVNHTQAEAVAWAQAQAGNPRDYDGVYGVQCVDLIKFYYAYLGVSPVSGNGCDYAKNALPSGWQRIQAYNGFVPQPGDVAVWTYASSAYGHVAIVLSADSYSMTVVEFLGSSHTARTNTYRYTYGRFYGVIRPNFSSTAPSVTYENIPEGNYAIVNKSSGKYLNALAYAGQAKAGTNICVSDGDGTGEQKFRLQAAGESRYYIRSLSNGSQFCVNANSGATVSDGADVRLWDYNEVPSKLWKFCREGDYYIIYNAMNPNLVLTADGNSARSNVSVRAYVGSDLQRWKLEGEHTSHTYTESITKNASCTEYGTKTFSCSVCGHSYTQAIPALGHLVVTVEGKAATCTQSGKTAGASCSRCGAVIKAQETISPLGHEWLEGWSIDKDATETEDGEKSRHCLRCDARTDITVIPKTEERAEATLEVWSEHIEGTFMNIDWFILKKAGQDITSMELRIWQSDDERPSQPDYVEPYFDHIEDEGLGSAFSIGEGGDVKMELAYGVEYRYEVSVVIDGKLYTAQDTFIITDDSAQFVLDSKSMVYANLEDQQVIYDVILECNPGIASVNLSLTYDEDLFEFVALEKGSVFETVIGSPECIMMKSKKNTMQTGVVCSLVFRLKNTDPSNDFHMNLYIDECLAKETTETDAGYRLVQMANAICKNFEFVNENLAVPKDYEQKLLDAFLSDYDTVQLSSAATEWIMQAPDVYEFSQDISGTYSLIFTDTDKDGQDELLAFGLCADDENRSPGHPLLQCVLVGYDVDSSGQVKKGVYKPQAFDSAGLYEMEGFYHYGLSVDSGRVALLRYFIYDSMVYDYYVVSFENGEWQEQAAYEFVGKSSGAEDFCWIRNLNDQDEEIYAKTGSREVQQAVSNIMKELEQWVTDYWLFPVDSDGEVYDASIFSEQSDMDMYVDYDPDTNIKTFHVRDYTNSWAQFQGFVNNGEADAVLLGDMNNDGQVDSDDAIHLLYYTFLPDKYPITQNGDLDGNDMIDSDDAIYLLYYTFLPEKYPLR